MKRLFIVFSLTAMAGYALACSCSPYESNFFKNVSNLTHNCIAVFDKMDYSYEHDGLKSHTGFFILIDTIGAFHSNLGDTIVVTGQDGINCGELLTGFSQGDTVFLALLDLFYESFEKDTFYLEGACGTHYLKIRNGHYAGLSVSEIKSKIYEVLERKSQSCYCYDIGNIYDFYNNVSNSALNCLVVFHSYDYSYSFNGLNAQTGYFELLDTIGYSESQIGDTIVVVGEDGINCGEMLNLFSPGDTLFLALSDGYYETFEKDTFYLKSGNCGKYYLRVTGGQNSGLSIAEIKDKIRSKITNDDKVEIDKRIKFYPSPATDHLTIESNADLIQDIRIYDLFGKLSRSVVDLNRLMINIDLTGLVPGLYLILVDTDSGTPYRKIVEVLTRI